MSEFKVFLIVGGAVGILAGGTVALFKSGKKPASSASAGPRPSRVPVRRSTKLSGSTNWRSTTSAMRRKSSAFCEVNRSQLWKMFGGSEPWPSPY